MINFNFDYNNYNFDNNNKKLYFKMESINN